MRTNIGRWCVSSAELHLVSSIEVRLAIESALRLPYHNHTLLIANRKPTGLNRCFYSFYLTLLTSVQDSGPQYRVYTHSIHTHTQRPREPNSGTARILTKLLYDVPEKPPHTALVGQDGAVSTGLAPEAIHWRESGGRAEQITVRGILELSRARVPR